jgi:hypothetical protein
VQHAIIYLARLVAGEDVLMVTWRKGQSDGIDTDKALSYLSMFPSQYILSTVTINDSVT